MSTSRNSEGHQNETESSVYQVDGLMSEPTNQDGTSSPPLVDTSVHHTSAEQDTGLSDPSTSKTSDYNLTVTDPNVELEYNSKLNIFQTKKPSPHIDVPKPLLSFVEHKMRKRSICLPRDKPPCKKKCTQKSSKKSPKKTKAEKSNLGTKKQRKTVMSTPTSSSLSLIKSNIGDDSLNKSDSNLSSTPTNPLVDIVAACDSTSTSATNSFTSNSQVSKPQSTQKSLSNEEPLRYTETPPSTSGIKKSDATIISTAIPTSELETNSTLEPTIPTGSSLHKITPELTTSTLESETLYIIESTCDNNLLDESATDPFCTPLTPIDPLFADIDPFDTSFTTPITIIPSQNTVSSTPTNSLINKEQTTVFKPQSTSFGQSSVLQKSDDETKSSTSSSEQLEPNTITFVDINKVKPEDNDDIQEIEFTVVKNKPKCLKCATQFNDLREVQRHMRSVHSSEFPCIQCDSVLTTREHLLDHLMGAHHICVTCQIQFLSRKSFTKHHTEHAQGNVYIYQCAMCRSTERTYSAIQRHIQLNHRNNLLRRNTIVENYRKNIPLVNLYSKDELLNMNHIQCNYCLLILEPEKLETHYKFAHYIINCENCNSLISLSQIMPYEFEILPVQCKYCDFKFEIGKNDSKLFNLNRKRLQFFEDITTHECRHCFKYFKNVHVKDNHELNCPCEHKNHASKMNFQTGINSELSSILSCELPCLFCDKYFKYAALTSHLMEVHHFCGVCDEKFTTSLQFEEHKEKHESREITHVTCNVCFANLPPKTLFGHFGKFHPFALLREKVLKSVNVDLPVFDTSALEMNMCPYCYGIFRKTYDFEEHLRRRHHIYCCIICKYFALQLHESEPKSLSSLEIVSIPIAPCKNNARSKNTGSGSKSLNSNSTPSTSHKNPKSRTKNSNNQPLSSTITSSLSTNDVPSTSNQNNSIPQGYTYNQLIASVKSNESLLMNDLPSTSCQNKSTSTTCNEYEFVDFKKEIVAEDMEICNQLTPENLVQYQFIDIKEENMDETYTEYENNLTPIATVLIADQESNSNPQIELKTYSQTTEIETKIEIVEESITEFAEISTVKNTEFSTKIDEVEMKGRRKKTTPCFDDSDEHKTYSFLDVNELVMDSCRTTIISKKVTPKCLKCELNFNSRTEFMDHFTTIHSLELPCTLCDTILTERDEMIEHLTNIHHICIPCRLEFPNEHTFLEHRIEHDNNRVYLYRCCQCRIIVTSFSTIQRHMQSTHRQLPFEMDSLIKVCRKNVTMLKIYSELELEEMYRKQCNYCLKLVKPDRIALHYKYFHYIVRCENCKCVIQLPKYFKTSVKLNCSYCEYQFSMKGLVTCKFLFTQGKGYQKFEYIKTYECRYCFRYFSNVAQKNVHEFQCPCDHENHEKEIEPLPKTSTGCVNDTAKILSYTLPCIFCKVYIVYKKLSDHLMEAHKYCGICDESFPNLEQHKYLHETNKIQHLTCTRCFINYSPKKMITHVQKFHGSTISSKTIFKTVTVNIPEFKLGTGGSAIVCAICYGNFSVLCDFEEHLRRRHSIFCCVDCRYFILQDIPDT